MAGANNSVVDAVYLLPALEPILGIAVALNLAYLNIPKFQYISIVRDKLKQRLDKLDPNVREWIKHITWFKQLHDLASVDTLDLEWPNFTKKIYISAPAAWGKIYNAFFYWRLGRVISMAFTLYALFLLILGAGHASGAATFAADYFNEHIGRHYFWSIASVAWPTICVVAGEYVCLSAARFVKYQTGDLQDQAQANAEKAVEDLAKKLDAATGASESGAKVAA